LPLVSLTHGTAECPHDARRQSDQARPVSARDDNPGSIDTFLLSYL